MIYLEAKQRFSAVRTHYGLSMREFGSKIGLTASGISAIEYGTRTMSEKHIKLICAAFPDISEQWLRTGEGVMFIQRAETDQTVVDQITEAYDGSPTFRALMTAYLNLDEPRRRTILDFIGNIFVNHFNSVFVPFIFRGYFFKHIFHSENRTNKIKP